MKTELEVENNKITLSKTKNKGKVVCLICISEYNEEDFDCASIEIDKNMAAEITNTLKRIFKL